MRRRDFLLSLAASLCLPAAVAAVAPAPHWIMPRQPATHASGLYGEQRMFLVDANGNHQPQVYDPVARTFTPWRPS